MMQLAYLIFDGLEALLKPASPPPFSVQTNKTEISHLTEPDQEKDTSRRHLCNVMYTLDV